jgi:hypothetical protein
MQVFYPPQLGNLQVFPSLCQPFVSCLSHKSWEPWPPPLYTSLEQHPQVELSSFLTHSKGENIVE